MSADTLLEELGVNGLGGVDEPAFSGLAERHRRELHVHCYWMLGSFEDDEDTVQETYLRQMLGSANISGSKAMHFMTGNLSHQVEHHLFPDLPSNRYAQIAPQVRALFAKYDLPYVTGPLPRQVASAWKKVIRLSLPNDFGRKAQAKVLSIAAPGQKESAAA